MRAANLPTRDISRLEVAQLHLRHLVGGRARSFTGNVPDERIYQVCAHTSTRCVCIHLPGVSAYIYQVCVHTSTRCVCIHLPGVRIHASTRCVRIHASTRCVRLHASTRCVRIHASTRCVRIHASTRCVRIHACVWVQVHADLARQVMCESGRVCSLTRHVHAPAHTVRTQTRTCACTQHTCTLKCISTLVHTPMRARLPAAGHLP